MYGYHTLWRRKKMRCVIAGCLGICVFVSLILVIGSPANGGHALVNNGQDVMIRRVKDYPAGFKDNGGGGGGRLISNDNKGFRISLNSYERQNGLISQRKGEAGLDNTAQEKVKKTPDSNVKLKARHPVDDYVDNPSNINQETYDDGQDTESYYGNDDNGNYQGNPLDTRKLLPQQHDNGFVMEDNAADYNKEYDDENDDDYSREDEEDLYENPPFRPGDFDYNLLNKTQKPTIQLRLAIDNIQNNNNNNSNSKLVQSRNLAAAKNRSQIYSDVQYKTMHLLENIKSKDKIGHNSGNKSLSTWGASQNLSNIYNSNLGTKVRTVAAGRETFLAFPNNKRNDGVIHASLVNDNNGPCTANSKDCETRKKLYPGSRKSPGGFKVFSNNNAYQNTNDEITPLMSASLLHSDNKFERKRDLDSTKGGADDNTPSIQRILKPGRSRKPGETTNPVSQKSDKLSSQNRYIHVDDDDGDKIVPLKNEINSQINSQGNDNGIQGQLDRFHGQNVIVRQRIETQIPIQDAGMDSNWLLQEQPATQIQMPELPWQPGEVRSPGGVPLIVDKIFWSKEVEDLIPTGITNADFEHFLHKLSTTPVKHMQNPQWNRCGRPRNQYVQLKDGTPLCARFREEHVKLIHGEVLSFHFSRMLGLDNVPIVVLSEANNAAPQWLGMNITAAGWNESSIVALIQWIDGLESERSRVRMPTAILEAFENGGVFDHHHRDVHNLQANNLTELVQWSDMILFDYLTGHYDRVASMQDGADRENKPSIMHENIRNLRKVWQTSKMWLIDNESGLFDGYELLYHGGEMGRKFVEFHTQMLRTNCVFRRETVERILELANLPSPHEVLVRYVSAQDPLYSSLPYAAEAKLFQKYLPVRLKQVADWIKKCQTR